MLFLENAINFILHTRCNNVNNKNLALEKIANKRGDMAILCPGYDFNDIIITVMICRINFLNKNISRFNFFRKIY